MARNVYGDGYQYYHGKCCVFISHQQKDKTAAKMIANYLLGCPVRCSEKQMLKSPVKLLI